MSPVDFVGGPAAHVDMGDGTTSKIRFTADDGSCIWNGFPVYMYACGLRCGEIADPAPTSQIADWVTALTAAAQTPPEAKWPLMRIYRWKEALQCGLALEGRIRFTVSSGRGSYGIATSISGLGFSGGDTGVAVVNIDSGWQNLGVHTCALIDCDSDVATAGLVWANFNPGVADGITTGRFQARWVSSGSPGTYIPCQTHTIRWVPPCDEDPGLYIGLATDACGALSTTYNTIVANVNALGLGITASALGGHGGDIAVPDPSCGEAPTTSPCEAVSPTTMFACLLDGAVCGGSVDDIAG